MKKSATLTKPTAAVVPVKTKGRRSTSSPKAGYDPVEWRGVGARREGRVEVKEETGNSGVLSINQRNQFINMLRDGMRNMPQVRAMAQQFRVNVVGTQGGKMSSKTGVKEWDIACVDWFGEWGESMDYRDGTGLNESLKLQTTEYSIGGGDFALVFDRGILTGGYGCGKVCPFESDMIGNMDAATFAKRYPSWTQEQGVIYDRFGRQIGLVVSPKKRGQSSYKAEECFVLTRDPDKPWHESDWFFGKRKWRLIQGRGISPQTVAIAMLIDIYEIQCAEVKSTKTGAQWIAQVLDTMGDTPEQDEYSVSSEVEAECKGAAGKPTTGEANEAGEAGEEKQPDEKVHEIEASKFKDATDGGQTMLMPPGMKMEILDTKRPNTNIQQFVEWLQRNAGAVHGLARVYATMKAEASYTAFKGEQCITMPSFEELQKELERGSLTWMAVKAIRWGIETRQITVTPPQGWERKLVWTWPKLRDVSEVDAERARLLRFQNKATCLMEILGPDWEAKLDQIALEVKKCVELGIIHPSQLTSNGMFAEMPTPEQMAEFFRQLKETA